MIVYLARDISPFVMYCVYGESGSSLIDYDKLCDEELLQLEKTDDKVQCLGEEECTCVEGAILGITLNL